MWSSVLQDKNHSSKHMFKNTNFLLEYSFILNIKLHDSVYELCQQPAHCTSSKQHISPPYLNLLLGIIMPFTTSWTYVNSIVIPETNNYLSCLQTERTKRSSTFKIKSSCYHQQKHPLLPVIFILYCNLADRDLGVANFWYQ